MQEPSLRYKRIMEAPVSDDIGSRNSRRWKVVALYGSYVVLCGATALRTVVDSPAGRIVAGVLLIAGVLSAGYGFIGLMGRTFVNAPNMRESVFDERQRQRRNDAIQRSFPVIGMASAVCVVYATFADTLVPAWRNATVVQALFWGIFLLSVSLPSAIIAWTEPDPQVLDEVERTNHPGRTVDIPSGSR